jgi:tight adherence protein B
MVAVGVISYLVFTARERRPAALHHRLAQYSADVAKTGPKVQAAALLDLYESLEQQFGRRAFWKYLDRLCQRAGTNVHTGQIVLIIVACFAAPVLLLATGVGLLITLVACIATGSIPVVVLRFRAGRRQNKFDSQLPELLGVWASALRAGRSFAQALDTLVEEASEPAHDEFRRVQNQVRLGVPIEQALDDMSKRLGSESFELVVLTTDVQRRIGGNVAEFFDQVADTVRKRQQFSMRVRALTATGVLSARVLLGMPFALAGILTLINHSYMSPLYTTTTGHVLILIACLMMFAGYMVLKRIVKPRAVA